tara:strand:+ start:1242 stop:1841 length:600 start_codon:yes stop_codon:yes gene_type:complete
MSLYSVNGAEPSELIERIRLPNGMTLTGTDGWSQSELNAVGITGPYTIPDCDTKSQYISWNSETLTYDVLEKTYETMLSEFLSQVNKMIGYSEVSADEILYCSSEKRTELENFYTYITGLRDNPPGTRDALIALPTLERPSYDSLGTDLKNTVLTGMSTCGTISDVQDLFTRNNIDLGIMTNEDANSFISRATELNITS